LSKCGVQSGTNLDLLETGKAQIHDFVALARGKIQYRGGVNPRSATMPDAHGFDTRRGPSMTG